MKMSLKIASSAIGFALIAGASVASAQVSSIWAGTSATAVKNPAFSMVRVGSNLPVAATATQAIASASTTAAVSIPPMTVTFLLQPVGTVMASTASSSCSALITSFMKSGAANDKSQVLKLQSFLKTNQGLDVDATGIYDSKTLAAVNAFQRTYMKDIMGPWGATRTSGSVYLTTARKINELACGVNATLTPADMKLMADYQVAATAAASQQAAGSASVVAVGTDASSTVSMDGTMNSAAAGQPGVMSRFWSFIKSFFTK